MATPDSRERDYIAGISIVGQAIWYKLPKTAKLTKLDDHWRIVIWLEKSDRSDEHIFGLETCAATLSAVEDRGEALEREGVEDGHRHTVAPSAR